MVRRDLERLVEMLASLGDIDLALTTNGSLLASKARALKQAGLQRITVSLDSLDNTVFKSMNDVGFPLERVLQGIEEAAAVGLRPIKINMVVKRGVNEQSVLPMARHFRNTGHLLRFIEYMDVGNNNGWRLSEVVPAAEIVRVIDAEMPLEPLPTNYSGEVANRGPRVRILPPLPFPPLRSFWIRFTRASFWSGRTSRWIHHRLRPSAASGRST